VYSEKISGLQYSISFAPGIDYRIYRNYSVYFEPAISYYFDNKQPVSARTERPVVIGLNVGLRLEM
ncbi:MAG: porin family protein, partial [Dysgonamonadaceae bacterium]|nr:porin family protein [Dysgonamonadaceae bacterium]